MQWQGALRSFVIFRFARLAFASRSCQTLTSDEMAESAFIVQVPQAELVVGPLRERYDASVRLGIPAHITVLVPFMSPERIDQTVLQRAQQALDAVRAFAFSLPSVGRFPATAWLAPEPAQPFIEMTQSLVRCFPEYPPFRGEHDSIVPHLTVAHGSVSDAEVAAREIGATIRAQGPIDSLCRSVVLLENSSGMWRQMHAFVLPGGDRGG